VISIQNKDKSFFFLAEQCSSSSESEDEIEEDRTMEELSRKTQHPYRLHSDLWHNESGEMNDGPLCRCSARSRRSGIRHGIYPGESGFPKCSVNSNNADKLYHYRITITPPTNFLTKTPTIIKYDEHEFLFEGFSLFTHEKIGDELPTCKVIRFNIEYTILYVEEKMPENFTIRELDLFYNYLFLELLELVDFSLTPSLAGDNETCQCYHFYPRFVRELPDNGKEVLAMAHILRYLLDNSGPLVDTSVLKQKEKMGQFEWQDYVDVVKGMVVTNPASVPSTVRVDQLDRKTDDIPECKDVSGTNFPAIVHFGIRPPQLSYAGNPEYQKAWREYVKFRHLIANMSKPSFDDKRKLEAKENRLQEMRTQGRMKRNVTVAISSKNFFRTGIMCDIVQHAMLLPVLTTHLRFHRSLEVLEQKINYKFKNRYLLQLALTHPSYKENFGTNPDHARNSLTNCGIRQPEYGDKKIHYMNTRKRGINTLINIMSRFGKEHEEQSNITHNERLEFLGDAVVEFITSIHLFHLFPDLEEGGLATYRAAIVQNQHLAILARRFGLEQFMLFAHGSDLCHELELRHAMANCFEALMGALLLDGDIKIADKVFSIALMDDFELKDIWDNYPMHPLQSQEPEGDRKWIDQFDLLKSLRNFEEQIGIEFTHIRLLARAFTDRSIGYTNLTLGSNQRLEFLGDTVLQLICSEFLYRHFPEHHEGHLSLLRSSLVNNKTQAVVCDDLGMTKYALYSNPKAELKTKDRADLLEAFLGALYVDKDLIFCETFCQVCLFPRLQDFIMNQDWNDPKSKLQQCCLTLRTMDGNEPDIPYYKVVESTGPTNTRIYKVAVYFREKRLGKSRALMSVSINGRLIFLILSSECDWPQHTASRDECCKEGARKLKEFVPAARSSKACHS
jgi:ribonuclease-3